MMTRLFAIVLITFGSTFLWAQSGSLDSTFSQDGIDIRDIGSGGTDLSFNGLLQPDGKILMVGWAPGQLTDFAILRYLVDGSLDTSFGIEGQVIADCINTQDRAFAITMQADGKIYVAGSTDVGFNTDYSLLRLHPDGSIDTTFGTQGWAVTDLGTAFEYPNAVAVQADGKIITAGRVEGGNFSDFGMVRYHANGELDTLFGDKGIVITDFREEDLVNDILIQADGQIILGGFSSVSAVGDFALARYNPDGTLDKFFGDGGKVLTDLEGTDQSDFINDLVLLENGKILAAGNANYNNLEFTSDMGIVRYLANGDVDETFGDDGVVIHSIGGRTNVEGVAVQQDNKIILCGETNAFPGEGPWFLARFLADGGLDTNFADEGLASTIFPGNATPNAVFVQPDTRIVVTGSAGISPNFDFAVARYIADFTITTFVSKVSCVGGSNAIIAIEINGGVAPYQYSIDGVAFQASNLFTDLAPGTYYITIKDSNGSGVTSTAGPYIVNEPHPYPLVWVDAPQDGNWIYIHVEGHHDNFLYSIDGGVSFQTDSVFLDLEDGVYNVVVMDANDCIVHTEQVLISTLGIASLMNTLPFNISPNPSDGAITLMLENTYGDKLDLKVIDVTGRIVFKSTLEEAGAISHKIDLRSLHNGSYILWITDQVRHGVESFIIAK